MGSRKWADKKQDQPSPPNPFLSLAAEMVESSLSSDVNRQDLSRWSYPNPCDRVGLRENVIVLSPFVKDKSQDGKRGS